MRTIVAGYDGSEHAADALALARVLRSLDDGRLIVASAFPEDPLGHSNAGLEVAGAVRDQAEETVSRARELLGADAAHAELRALGGASPAHVLHDVAEQEDAALIVVGGTHHGWAGRLISGSTPERVLEEAPCAVAVAPAGYARRVNANFHAARPHEIAVAYDGSPESDLALEEAVAYARSAGARVRLVSIVAGAYGVYPPLDPHEYDDIVAVATTAAGDRLTDAAARHAGVEIVTDVVEGEPVAELVAASEEADLLFAGSRREGPFRRVLLGSVSKKLLRAAKCPVVIAPRGSGVPGAER